MDSERCLPLHHGAVRVFPAAIEVRSMLDRHSSDPRESLAKHREQSIACAPVRGRWLAARDLHPDPSD